MKLILDAHALIWSVDKPAKLGPNAIQALGNPSNELLLSAGTLWEISIKVGLGKLVLSVPFKRWIEQAVSDLGALLVPIAIEHAEAQMHLPHHHGDPFDRLLVAQSQVEGFEIVSSDSIFDRYGAKRLW